MSEEQGMNAKLILLAIVAGLLLAFAWRLFV
jgi:hypothetical protein